VLGNNILLNTLQKWQFEFNSSGARVLVTLIYALKRINKKKGIASLCVGGGQGVAMAIELV
jgi:acetyl-CoA acetyltransferase